MNEAQQLISCLNARYDKVLLGALLLGCIVCSVVRNLILGASDITRVAPRYPYSFDRKNTIKVEIRLLYIMLAFFRAF